MPGYWDDVRQLRNEMRTARGAAPLRERRRKTGQDRPQPPLNEAPAWDETPHGNDAENSGAAAGLQAAVQQRDGELAEAKRLLAEMTGYVEQMEARVVELIAGAQPMARVLLLPGVKTFLLTKFHPDKYPDADDRQRTLLTEALKTINAAYALADELQMPPPA